MKNKQMNPLLLLFFFILSANLFSQPVMYVKEKSQMLSAYPNPASDILNIDLSRATQREGTLSILNFEGKTLVSRQVSNEGVLSLDISHLPAGIYLCRYSNVAEVKTVKIIKQ